MGQVGRLETINGRLGTWHIRKCETASCCNHASVWEEISTRESEARVWPMSCHWCVGSLPYAYR
jgi:hypothetical protein